MSLKSHSQRDYCNICECLGIYNSPLQKRPRYSRAAAYIYAGQPESKMKDGKSKCKKKIRMLRFFIIIIIAKIHSCETRALNKTVFVNSC